MDRWCYLDLSYYKYRLNADFSIKLTRYGVPADAVATSRRAPSLSTGFYTLLDDGTLTISKGYAWDGPSGPTFDTANFMRGSLVHDCLYQMMRARQLDETFRPFADLALRKICEEDGMTRLRAWWVHQGVSWRGGKHARPSRTGQLPDEVCLDIPLQGAGSGSS